MIIRGKYTFVIRLGLPTTLPELAPTPAAISVQGRIPAYANSGYATPSDGTRASFPKNNVNTIIVSAGCSTAHAMPSTVCL